MGRHGGGDGAQRAVRGDGQVFGLGHGGDLLGLHESAAQQQVRLQNVGGFFRDHVPELVLGVEHLARGDRNGDLPVQPSHGHDVLGPERLFEEHGVIGLDRLGHLKRPDRLEDAGVGIQAHVHVVAHRLANRRQPRRRPPEHLVPGQLLGVGRVRGHLDGGEPQVLGPLGRVGHLAGSAPTDAQIDPDPIPAAAADQFIDGNPQGFALQVPTGDLDAADGGVQDGTARKPGAVVEETPDVLDPSRVLSQDPVLEIVDRFLHGAVRTDAVGFPDPVQMLVGQDLDEDVVAVPHVHAEGLNVDDLHGLPRLSETGSWWEIVHHIFQGKEMAPFSEGLEQLGTIYARLTGNY